MPSTVWKYDLAVTDVQEVMMPSGAALLHVGIQHPNEGRLRWIQLWAWVDREEPTCSRRIAVVGTGNPAPPMNEARYVGSVQDGPFVWHIFDGGEVG